MSREIPETSRPCPNCGNPVTARRMGNIKCGTCGMKLKVTSDGDIVSHEYEPTMKDLNDYSHGIKTEGSDWWSGHVRDTIGSECEAIAEFAFSVPLEKIPDSAHNKPDYVNSDHRVVVEVYAGTDIGDIDRESTDELGMPYKRRKPYDVRAHLMKDLRHAKDKMNQDTVDYLSQNHGIVGDFTYLAMYVMEFEVYSSLDEKMMIDIYSECTLADYCVDGIVIYWRPATLIETYGGDVFVLYDDESRLDRSVFVESAKFICLGEHRKERFLYTDARARVTSDRPIAVETEVVPSCSLRKAHL